MKKSQPKPDLLLLFSAASPGKMKKTDAPEFLRYVCLSFYPYRVKLVLVAQSLGIGLASVFAAAAVDALRGHNADFLIAVLALNNSAGGTFFHALFAEGAQFGINSIHSSGTSNKFFLAGNIVPHLLKNAIQKS